MKRTFLRGDPLRTVWFGNFFQNIYDLEDIYLEKATLWAFFH